MNSDSHTAIAAAKLQSYNGEHHLHHQQHSDLSTQTAMQSGTTSMPMNQFYVGEMNIGN
jgi:hypothetical protein